MYSNPKTGNTAWRLPLLSAPSAGMLATGGGLVFTGDNEGNFLALDAKTGKVLWRFPCGASISNGPISYRFRGKQYITVAAGTSLITFGL